MEIRQKIKEDSAFQYVVQSLDIISSVGKRQLMGQPFLTEASSLEQEWSRIEKMCKLLQDSRYTVVLNELRHQLMQLHDIRSTLIALSTHQVLSEVELFEVKLMSQLCQIIRGDLLQLGFSDEIAIPDTVAVFALLDPDDTHIANFYIYDSYHCDLGPLRREIRELQSIDHLTVAQQEELNTMLERHDALQQEVITQLSDQLVPYAAILSEALEAAGYCDMILAKSQQALDWGLTRPHTGKSLALHGLFHPQLKRHHEEHGRRYQPVDLQMNEGVCLITGANMAGKTVLLKSVACCQLMAQFGMFVPAEQAVLPLADDAVSCIGDEQDEMQGLSSYAAEILRISRNLQRSRKERLLLLIDEPARTTNPVEGQALVTAIAALLNRQQGFALVTTHYSDIGVACQRMRVRGFDEHLATTPINAESINQFIDYSLVEEHGNEVPHEAIRIAELLGCDSEMLQTAKAALK